MNNVSFSKNALNDLHSLPQDSISELFTLCSRLASNIYLGKELGNHSNRDLTGCYSLYFNEAAHRIVYTIDTTKQEAQIIAIGKRENFHVYNLAYARKNQ